MKKEACPKCGLIQLKDIIYGFAICDSTEAYFFGCPDKETVLEHVLGAEYDESKIIPRPLLRPFLL